MATTTHKDDLAKDSLPEEKPKEQLYKILVIGDFGVGELYIKQFFPLTLLFPLIHLPSK